MGTVANLNDWEPVSSAPAPVKQALLGQESGNNPDAPTSVDGAVGKAQIEPDTFAQYALPGEKIDNQKDNDAVYNRIVDHLYAKSGGDPARTAVGYFSGAGNIAPEGSSTPWKNNAKDGNGKSVASYVGDISDRLNTPTITTAEQTTPASQVTTHPDLSEWEPVESSSPPPTAAVASSAEIDPRLPLKDESFPSYSARQFGNSISKGINGVGSVLDQMKGGASDLYDLVTGDTDFDANANADKIVESGASPSAGGKQLFLNSFANNPGGKALGASRLFPPIAMGAAVINDVINPALEKGAEALGLDKEDVPLAEIPLMATGAKAGKETIAPDFITKPVIKATAAAKDVAGVPIDQNTSVPTAFLKTVDSQQPLLVSHTGVNEGINALKQFADTDGIDLNKTADKLEQIQKVDPNARAIDAMTQNEGDIPTGANIMGLAKSIAQSPGEGRTMLSQMTARGKTERAAISGDFKKSMGASPYFNIENDAIQQRDNTAPLYQQAFAANKSMMTPKISQLLERPAGQQALARAATTMQNDGALVGVSDPDLVEQAALTGTTIPKGGIASGLKMQTLHYVKKALYDMSQSKENTNQYGKPDANGSAILGMYHDLNGEIKSNDATRQPNQPDSGLYAQGNSRYANGAKIQSALENGYNFRQMQPEEIQKFITDENISDPEKHAFATGAVRNIQDGLSKGNTGTNPINGVWNDYIKERVKPLFPSKKSFNNFDKRMELRKTKATVNTVMGGSPTYANEAFSKVPAPPHTLPGRIASEVPVVGSMIGYGIDKALAKTGDKMSQDAKAVVARLLTSKDPKELRAIAAKVKGNTRTGYKAMVSKGLLPGIKSNAGIISATQQEKNNP